MPPVPAAGVPVNVAVPLLLSMRVTPLGSAPTVKVMAGTGKPVVVTVTMTDFAFKLSQSTVPAGQVVTFKVINKGRSAHNFDIGGSKHSPFLAPGKSFTFKATLKAGGYAYVCTVPRHAELGMRGDLTAS